MSGIRNNEQTNQGNSFAPSNQSHNSRPNSFFSGANSGGDQKPGFFTRNSNTNTRNESNPPPDPSKSFFKNTDPHKNPPPTPQEQPKDQANEVQRNPPANKEENTNNTNRIMTTTEPRVGEQAFRRSFFGNNTASTLKPIDLARTISFGADPKTQENRIENPQGTVQDIQAPLQELTPVVNHQIPLQTDHSKSRLYKAKVMPIERTEKNSKLQGKIAKLKMKMELK